MIFILLGCNAQSNPRETSQEEKIDIKIKEVPLVGGGCDGCELMFIDMPKQLTSIDTSAAWFEEGKRLVIQGKIVQLDSKTPASNVILYYWQTDNNGYYSSAEGLSEQAKRHGHIRGWVQSDAQGNYAIYTIKPAPYPNRDFPAHIHLSIKEPSIDDEYYIDNLVFDDDPLLTIEKREALDNRGGSGILTSVIKDGVIQATHDIVLGLNIPAYPD